MKNDLAKYAKVKAPLDPFSQNVIRVILKIPRGKVATYGQIADLIGSPNKPRQVGMVLKFIAEPDKVPWQRVIGSSGRILFPKRNQRFKQQTALLTKEGVAVIDGRVDLAKYQWRRKAKIAKGQRAPRMFT